MKYPPDVAAVLVHFARGKDVDLVEIVESFRALAHTLADRDPTHPLMPVTLHKLLEALDAAKRSARPMSTNQLG